MLQKCSYAVCTWCQNNWPGRFHTANSNHGDDETGVWMFLQDNNVQVKNKLKRHYLKYAWFSNMQVES